MTLSKKTPSFHITPLGGLGEIGMNLMAYEFDGEILVVDCGITFPGADEPGVDVVIPDPQYLLDNRDKVCGLALTHGHEDHLGGVPHIWPDFYHAPIYGTAMTLGLLAGKLKEYELTDKISTELVPTGGTVKVGPFSVQFIPVTHSIVDASALAITTPAGTIIHTGDFKFDHAPVVGPPSDLTTLGHLGSKGVLALLSDSTNVNKDGSTVPERDIEPIFEETFADAEGLVVVAAFSSNIHRLQQVIRAAVKVGRKVILNGRSMVNNARVARELGFLKIPDKALVDIKRFKDHPRNGLVVLSTGSQAEPRSSLVRIANGEHKEVKIQPGDTVVFSSKFIPGNEGEIHALINLLYKDGATVIHEKIAPIHVSGHAPREDLKLMIALTRPKFFIPIHGETRHLNRHKKLAMEVGVEEHRALVIENGDRVRVNQNEALVEDQIESGRVNVDGKVIGDVGDIVIRDRLNLAQYGFVIATLLIDGESGALDRPPELLTRGVVFEDESQELLEDAKEAIRKGLEMGAEAMDFQEGEGGPGEIAQRALRRFFKKRLGRRPIVLTMVQEL